MDCLRAPVLAPEAVGVAQAQDVLPARLPGGAPGAQRHRIVRPNVLAALWRRKHHCGCEKVSLDYLICDGECAAFRMCRPIFAAIGTQNATVLGSFSDTDGVQVILEGQSGDAP